MTTYYRYDVARCPVGVLWRLIPRVLFPFAFVVKALHIEGSQFYYPFGRLNGTHFVAQESIPNDLRQTAAGLIKKPELSNFRLTDWIRFPTVEPTTKVIAAAFISEDGLYDLSAIWLRAGFAVKLRFLCASQLYNGGYAVTRPRSNREFYPPPEWEIASTPRLDLPTVLDVHRQHIAQKHTVPIRLEDVGPTIIRLNNQEIDHLVEEGYLIPLTQTEAALARGIEQP